MQQRTRRSTTLNQGWILVLAFLFALPVQASTSPRIWHFSRSTPAGEVQGYVLAITHLGLPIEYDDDFERVIAPAAMASSRLYAEGVGARHEVGSELPCEPPFTDAADIRLLQAEKTRLAQLEFEFYRDARDRGITFLDQSDDQIRVFARVDTNGLSEMGVMAGFRLFGRSQIPTKTSIELKGSVVNALANKVGANKVFDIDEPNAATKAYCRLNEKDRVDYLEQTNRALDPGRVSLDLESFDAALRKEASDFSETLHSTILADGAGGTPAFFRSFVCERTAEWIERIQRQPAGTVYFYAVGFAHVFPPSGPAPACQGILKDLQSAGFSISALN